MCKMGSPRISVPRGFGEGSALILHTAEMWQGYFDLFFGRGNRMKCSLELKLRRTELIDEFWLTQNLHGISYRSL